MGDAAMTILKLGLVLISVVLVFSAYRALLGGEALVVGVFLLLMAGALAFMHSQMA